MAWLDTPEKPWTATGGIDMGWSTCATNFICFGKTAPSRHQVTFLPSILQIVFYQNRNMELPYNVRSHYWLIYMTIKQFCLVDQLFSKVLIFPDDNNVIINNNCTTVLIIEIIFRCEVSVTTHRQTNFCLCVVTLLNRD